MTLHYFAHGESVETLSKFYYMGKSTAYKIIAEVSYDIWEVLSSRYLPMKTADDWQNGAEQFEKRWGFPNCIAAIDSKHIRIAKPPRSGSTSFNYKKYFSFVLMTACDADYRFSWVDVGDYGSLNDASIFGATTFDQELQANRYPLPTLRQLPGYDTNLSYFLIGALKALPLSPFMMRPYARRLVSEQAQTIFNYQLSRTRMTIENAFGILAGRWRVLHQPLHFNLSTSIEIVKALTCLHNFLITSERELPPEYRLYVDSRYIEGAVENNSVNEQQRRRDSEERNVNGNEEDEAEDQENISLVRLRIIETLTSYFVINDAQPLPL